MSWGLNRFIQMLSVREWTAAHITTGKRSSKSQDFGGEFPPFQPAEGAGFSRKTELKLASAKQAADLVSS